MGITFKETKIGLIPEDWQVKRIKDIANLGRGRVISHSDIAQNPGLYPVYSSQSKGDGSIGRLATYDFEGEYITWTTDGAYAGSVFFRNGRFNCTNVCGTVQLKVQDTDYQFLAYFLNRVAKTYVTYTGNPKLMNNEFAKILVAVPPLPEQRKIAEILSTVDEAIEKTDSIIQETQQLKKGLMHKLFSEGIGHTRFKETKIGRIPQEWEVVRFNQCLQKTNQKDPTKKPDEKFKYIDVSAVSNELFKIVESKTILGKDAPSRARKGINTGDTIYATVRPYLRRVAFVPSELDGEICSTGYCVLRPKSEEIFDRFVFQLMLTHRVNEYLESLQAGTSYPAISDSDVYQMLIPKPPLREQHRIAEILYEVDAKIEKEQAFKAELEQLKKGLMQVLLTGKVRVKV